MYKLIASDMDETFLGEDHRIPAANVGALRRLRELGVMFVPASGRPYSSVMDSLASVTDLLEGSYLLSYNGGCVNRIGSPEPLFSRTLDFEKARQLFDYGLTQDVGMHVYELSGKMWGFRISDEERAFLAGAMKVTETDRTSIEFLRDVPIAKILYVKPDNLPFLENIEKHMGNLLDGITVTYSSKRYLELCPEGVDKGNGIRSLAQHLGLDLSQVICMGDSANDVGMIEAAGLGVAAANATPDALGAADYVSQATCDEGVLAEVVDRFVDR